LGDDGLHPQTLDIDADGNIYVGGGREIWVYDRDGARAAVWQYTAARPVRVGPDGCIYAGRTWEPNMRLRALDRGGNYLRTLAMDKWLHGDRVGFDVPYDLLFDPDGNIWSTNTHNEEQKDRTRDTPNTAWNGRRADPNGGRLMFFDLKNDPEIKRAAYFGTFSNNPPEAGGPADALYMPKRLAFDGVHRRIMVVDGWGVTRWSWPDGKFEKRIIRKDVWRSEGLIAATPAGTLYLRLEHALEEYDVEGTKLRDLPMDVREASDLRVTPDGCVYACYPNPRIAFRKFAPDGTLLLCRGLNVVETKLETPELVVDAGSRVPVVAEIVDRRDLYKTTLPELEEIEKTLWLRPWCLGTAWRRLPLETGTDGEPAFLLPDDVYGAFELVLSTSAVAPYTLDGSSKAVSMFMAARKPGGNGGSIWIGTDRNQRLFVSGEWMRINAVGRSANAIPAEKVEVTFANGKGAVLAKADATWTIAANSSAAVRVDLILPDDLPPGEYTLAATSPALGRAACTVEVREPRENGRFAMISNLALGTMYPTEAAEATVRIAAADGITHDTTRYINAYGEYGTTGNDLEQNRRARSVLAADPRLPAPESAELPTRMRAPLHAMGAAGMHIWPEMMGWEADTVNRTDEQKSRDAEQLSLWTHWGLKNPAQDGFLWNETNWWGVDQSRVKPEWSKATGLPAELLEGIRFNSLTEPKDRLTGDKLQAALSYHEFLAKTLYPGNYQAWDRYASSIRPGIIGSGVPAFYWINWPEWASQRLDAVLCYSQIEQMPPAFMLLMDPSYMKHDGKPFWAGFEPIPESGTGEHTARHLLPSLLHGVEGFCIRCDAYQEFATTRATESFPSRAHVHQAFADLKAVLEPVGKRLRSTQLRAELGIYFPRTARIQGGNPAWDTDMFIKRVNIALIACYHAHIPAEIIFDEDLKAGRFGSLKCLLLPGLDSEITDADRASLDEFVRRGGRIIVTPKCSEAYRKIGTMIDVDFGIWNDLGYPAWFANDAHLERRDRIVALARRLGRALSPYIKPPVKLDDPDVWYALRDGKDNRGRPLTWFIAVNQNFVENLRTDQLWKMTSSFNTLIPVMREAELPANFRYAYDLLGGKPLRIRGNRLPLDFRRFAARIFALSDQPLKAADLVERVDEPPARPRSAQPAMTVVPDVDVFFRDKIRAALADAPVLLVVADREEQAEDYANRATDSGLKAVPAQDPNAGPGVHLVVARPGDRAWRDEKDVLPVRLTENNPGSGRALLAWMEAWLPGLPPSQSDAIVLACADDDGFRRGLDALKTIRAGGATAGAADPRTIPPMMREAKPASLEEDTTRHWGARLSTIKAAGDVVAVGADEWGNNLFLLNASNGKLRASAKAGRFYVDRIWATRDGSRIGAEAIFPEDINGWLEVFDGRGASVARYAADGINSHGNFNFYLHNTRKDIFDFAVSPDGGTIYSSGNLGLTAMKADGSVLWRHDYSDRYTGLELLRNKWAARIDLTPDGSRLAAALTHELAFSLCPDDSFRGTSIVRCVEAASGKIIWETELPPSIDPKISEVKISADGRTIAINENCHGLVLLRDGKIIRQRTGSTARADVTYPGSFNELAWGANGMLYALAVERGHRHNGFRYGVIAFTGDGRPVWEYSQYEPVNSMAVFDDGRVAISDAARAVKMLSADGTPLWSAATEATASVCAGGTALYACDWRGNVLAFAADSGKLRWKTNVTQSVWRDDIERLPAQPYAGRSLGARTRRPAEQPMPGENIAPQAKVAAGGIPGWFGTGKVQIQPAALTDGTLNDLEQPWLAVVECYKAGNNARYVWAEFEWQDDVPVKGLAVHEDERHPESWPWEVCLQVWQDGRWHDAAVSLFTPGPWHNVILPQPVSTRRIRYCVTGVLMNNVRTDEIRVLR